MPTGCKKIQRFVQEAEPWRAPGGTSPERTAQKLYRIAAASNRAGQNAYSTLPPGHLSVSGTGIPACSPFLLHLL